MVNFYIYYIHIHTYIHTYIFINIKKKTVNPKQYTGINRYQNISLYWSNQYNIKYMIDSLAKTPYVTNHVYFKFEWKKIALICTGLWEKVTKCSPKRKWEFKNKKKRKLERYMPYTIKEDKRSRVFLIVQS